MNTHQHTHTMWACFVYMYVCVHFYCFVMSIRAVVLREREESWESSVLLLCVSSSMCNINDMTRTIQYNTIQQQQQLYYYTTTTHSLPSQVLKWQFLFFFPLLKREEGREGLTLDSSYIQHYYYTYMMCGCFVVLHAKD
jgi:hypothetical protein